jgi:hypothetical protein
MKDRFNSLFERFLNTCTLNEGELVVTPDDANTTTAYDNLVNIARKLINDPRELLPPVDFKKFIIKDNKVANSWKFEWRYGNNVHFEVKATDDEITLYDINKDQVVFSTDKVVSTPDVQDVVFVEIDKIVNSDKEKSELGVEVPLDMGTNNTSSLPDAEREKNANDKDSSTSKYLQGLYR